MNPASHPVSAHAAACDTPIVGVNPTIEPVRPGSAPTQDSPPSPQESPRVPDGDDLMLGPGVDRTPDPSSLDIVPAGSGPMEIVAPADGAAQAVDVGGGMSVERHGLPASASQPEAAPPANTVSSLRQVLNNPAEIRRDSTPPPPPIRVAMPRPTAEAIEAIDALYEQQGAWADVAKSIERARPYQLPRARFVMIIETNRAFERTGINKIMQSFLKDNDGNARVKELIDHQQIGQICKGRGGDIRVKVKTRAACEQLAGQDVRILGKVYQFQGFDILADRQWMDVSNVDSDFSHDKLMQRLFEIGTEPIYGTDRDVNLESGMTTATWRVYFRSNRPPAALVINGQHCDQLLFEGRLYPVQAKNAPFPSQRRGFGQRSPHLLDLTPSEERGDEVPNYATPPRRSYASAVRDGASSTLKRAPASAVTVKDPTTVSIVTRKEKRVVARTVPADDTVSELSLSSRAVSNVSPPGSPQITPKPLPASTTFVEASVERQKKRKRCAEDFATLLRAEKPKVVDGISTSNYFAALATIDVGFDCQYATVDDDSSPRFQIVPRPVDIPAAIVGSEESSHFLMREHTTIKKAEATTISAVAAELAATEAEAWDLLEPTKIVAADQRVQSVRKTLLETNNPDTVVHMATTSAPVAFNAALLGEMSVNSPRIDELAQLHMIQRILSASDCSENKTFAHKWAKYIDQARVPKKRCDVFRAVAKWWKNEKLQPLIRATRALSMFEIALMCTAPKIFVKDSWIQRITGHPVMWIPTTNGRLLHPSTLFALARSELGKLVFQTWETVQWQSMLMEDLDYIQSCEQFYPEDGVLQLKEVDGSYVLTADRISLSN